MICKRLIRFKEPASINRCNNREFPLTVRNEMRYDELALAFAISIGLISNIERSKTPGKSNGDIC